MIVMARPLGVPSSNDAPAIPAETLDVNGLGAIGPSIVLYGRPACNPIEPDRSFMRPCSPMLGVVILR